MQDARYKVPAEVSQKSRAITGRLKRSFAVKAARCASYAPSESNRSLCAALRKYTPAAVARAG